MKLAQIPAIRQSFYDEVQDEVQDRLADPPTCRLADPPTFGLNPGGMTLLQQRDLARHRRRLAVHDVTRRQLREALATLIPGHRVIVFGSLTRPGVFNDRSDVDLALETEPPGLSALRLMGELSERLERPVDVILLANCRFRDKILREGEVWTV
jgi:predicted nucleotidyltransferase